MKTPDEKQMPKDDETPDQVEAHGEMETPDAVLSLEATIDTLDDQLDSGDPAPDSDQWNLLYKKRTQLDADQTELLKKKFQQDDDKFKTITATIEDATKKLNDEIAAEQRVDKIIGYAGDILNAADELLKLV